MEGTWLADCVAELYGELDARRIRLHPHVWISDEWFSPANVPGFAIPFYLTHPRLMKLERHQLLEVEGGTHAECMQIMRHECGHAIQHKHAYWPLQLRMTVVPVTMVASKLLPLVMIGGLWFHMMGFITLGIFVYAILTVFQLITLPVEFDASSRAKRILRDTGMVMADEADGVNTVLNAAAWTYVAAFLSALTYLLHLLAIRNSRD